MERVYHRYEDWECFKNGFFKNISGEEKKLKSLKVIEIFTNEKETEFLMLRVVKEWINSSEHNLTNLGLNRVAWLGQSACCIGEGLPYKITMETWRLVPEKDRIKACEIAQEIITDYEKQQKTKQLCLKFI